MKPHEHSADADVTLVPQQGTVDRNALLQLSLEMKQDLGINLFNGFPDNGIVTQEQFERRMIEAVPRNATLQHFQYLLRAGQILGHLSSAVDIVRTYAFDANYPYKDLAVKAIAPYDASARKALENMEGKARQQRIEEAANRPRQAIIHTCCGER